MSACEKHQASPAKGYSACAGCELERVELERQQAEQALQQAQATIAALQAELAARPVIPAGWKAAPPLPTEEMFAACILTKPGTRAGDALIAESRRMLTEDYASMFATLPDDPMAKPDLAELIAAAKSLRPYISFWHVSGCDGVDFDAPRDEAARFVLAVDAIEAGQAGQRSDEA